MRNKIKKGKFLYYLCPIGMPNFWDKWHCLQHNLSVIHKSIGVNFDIIVNCYSPHADQKNFLKNHLATFSFIDNVFIHNRQGVLANVFLSNPHNKLVKNYDYVYFTLDDVKIRNLDFNQSLKLLNEKGVSALTPKIEASTHPWFPQGIHVLNYTEIYCFFLKSKNFDHLMSCFSKTNPWFWGSDAALGYNNFFPIVCSYYTCTHLFKGNGKENVSRLNDGCRYIKSISPYNNISEMANSYPLIKSTICSSLDEAKVYLGIPLSKKSSPKHINTLPRGITRKFWNKKNHKEKYNLAKKWGWKDIRGIRLSISQPNYNPDSNNFLPKHTEQVTSTPIARAAHINILPLGFKSKQWKLLSHEDKYKHAIKWGWKATNGKYLSDAQPKGYDPNSNNFLPN